MDNYYPLSTIHYQLSIILYNEKYPFCFVIYTCGGGLSKKHQPDRQQSDTGDSL